MSFLVFLLVMAFAILDFYWTAVGIAGEFSITEGRTLIFPFVAAAALSASLTMLPMFGFVTGFHWAASAFVLTYWILALIFNIITTFGGLAVFIGGKDFEVDSVFQVMGLIREMDAVQLGVVFITTLFVVTCTFMVGLLFRRYFG